jgi:DNA-binding MarR family transcriptional regulator
MLNDAIKEFFYTLSLSELHMMNRKLLKPDVTYNTLLYLDLIVRTPNCTASHLAQLLHVTKPAVTAKINDLISQGLVEKVQNPQDKRVFYLKVSPEVARCYAAYDQNTAQAVSRAEEQFTPEELAVFRRVLGGICQQYMEGISQNE